MDAARLEWSSNFRHAIKSRIAAALAYRWPLTKSNWVLICLIAFVATAGSIILCMVRPDSHLEHGPLENFQALAIAVGALTFTFRAVASPGLRRIVAGLALFCLIFLMLEFDTRAFDMPVLRRWTNGAFRNAWLGTLTAIYGFAVIRNFRSAWMDFLQWLGSRSGLLMLVSGAFWVTGEIFEVARYLGPVSALMLEEVMEVSASLFMALSALWPTDNSAPPPVT